MSAADVSTPTQSRQPTALTIRSVLVCTDLSTVSERAIDVAVDLCRSCSAELTILHVSEYHGTSRDPVAILEMDRVKRCIAYGLKNRAEAVRSQGVRVRLKLLDGNIAEKILSARSMVKADIIVAGTHARQGIERAVLGSTAEAIIRSAPCPVMTVGPELQREGKQMLQGPAILATDFDDGSQAIAQFAADFAELRRAELRCIYVLPKTIGEGKSSVIALVMESALQRMLSTPDGRGRTGVCEVLYADDSAEGIVDYATAKGAQAIVLGVQRGSWCSSHLSGEITSRILMRASCPVVTLLYDVPLAAQPFSGAVEDRR